MDATASAVMGDVMAIARNAMAGGHPRTPAMGYLPDSIGQLPIKPMREIVSQYYLRFTALDKPGVVAKISGILGRYGIGIASMIQPDRKKSAAVPIVIMTHEATEAVINDALAEIDQLDIVREPSHFIRIENDME